MQCESQPKMKPQRIPTVRGQTEEEKPRKETEKELAQNRGDARRGAAMETGLPPKGAWTTALLKPATRN